MIQNKNPYIPFFTLTNAGVLFLGFVIGIVTIQLVTLLISFFVKQDFEHQSWYLVFSNAMLFCTAILFYVLFSKKDQKDQKIAFRFSTPSFYPVVVLVPLMFCTMLISEFFVAIIPKEGLFFGDLYRFYNDLFSSLSLDPWSMLIMTVIMAPFFEEIIFRGIIQNGLVKSGVSPTTAILVSSLVFGIIHGNPWQFVGAFILGTVLGFTYHKFQTLFWPIFLHAFNNLLASLLVLYNGEESFSTLFSVPEWGLLGVGTLFFIFFFALFTRIKSPTFVEL